VKGKLKKDPGYRCSKCAGGGCAEGGGDEHEVCLRMKAVFSVSTCFVTWVTLLGAAGGCGEASTTRVRGAGGQFKEFASMLTRRGIPLKQKDKVYRTCL